MASPLREARDDWRAQDQLTEPKASEKPEAAPYGDKNDVATPPGDLLVFLKGDLNNHRPWLESQFAAIQAGRERHERRLASQRQEEAAKDAQLDPPIAPQAALPGVEVPQPVGRAAARLRGILEPYLAKLPAGLTESAARIGERVSAEIVQGYAKSRASVLNAFAWSTVKAESLSPTIHDWIATAADRTARAANAASASAAPLLGKMQAVLRRGAERISSLLARPGETGRRQLLLIAGAALLICGAVVLGSILLSRAGAPTMEPAPIAWSFEAPSSSASNGIVFKLSGTPAQFRIDGLSFRGENRLDHPLTGVEAVVKADKPKLDLRLTLRTGRAQVAGEAHAVEVPLEPAASAADDVIPASAPFELVADFPGKGMSPEDFFESYGGLTLTMRYTADGRQRTLIQYLSPEMLKAQLAGVQAKGS